MSDVPIRSRVVGNSKVLGQEGIAEWLSHVQVVVFDLDGTLYEGTDFLDPYLEFLAEASTTGASAQMLREEIEDIIAGRHVLRLGSFYHPDSEVIVEVAVQDSEKTPQFVATRSLRWDGSTVDLDTHIPADGIPFDTDMVYVGDYWQAAVAVATQNGVSKEERARAFERTRELMNRTDYDLGVPQYLFEVLEVFADCRHRILVTNTPAGLAEACVDNLGVRGLFDEVHFGANKPSGLYALLQSLAARLSVRYDEILCVGDNYWNDVIPAAQLGCRTILVDAFDAEAGARSDARVVRFDDIRDVIGSNGLGG
jgi:FMN phosphatase YigB (HAD superfamily)